MSFYGRLAGGLIALSLAGGSAAYIASAAGNVMEAAEQTAAELSCYTLREYNGSVALFADGSSEPLAQYTTPISEVNLADAALLKDGIRLRGLSEVNRLLEDLDIE